MRKSYSLEFKSKQVLEVLRGERMLNEIASDNEVHPNTLTRWKTEATNNFHLLFENESAYYLYSHTKKAGYIWQPSVIGGHSRYILAWEINDTLEISFVQDAGSKISADHRGRAYDSIFIERFWRSLKYEDIYLKDYQYLREARKGIIQYMEYYNHKRLHQSLGDRTPASLYYGRE